MADVLHTEVFDCKPEEFFSILKDCEKYPEFLKDVKSCKVVKDDGDRKEVEFQISVIKNINYVNEHIEKAPNEIQFKFLRGDLFKTMNGHWKLTPEGEKTKAEYYVEATFGMLVPKMMTKTVLKTNLPAMMQAYHKRVAELFS